MFLFLDLFVIWMAGTALCAQTAQGLARAQAAVHCCRRMPASSASRRSNKKDDFIIIDSIDDNSSNSSNMLVASLVRPMMTLTTW